LNLYLTDDCQAWVLSSSGEYTRAQGPGEISAQTRLLSQHDERVALIEPQAAFTDS
jgi:hypothetical protein